VKSSGFPAQAELPSPVPHPRGLTWATPSLQQALPSLKPEISAACAFAGTSISTVLRGPSGRLTGMGPQKPQSPPAMGTPDPQQVVTGSEVRDTSLSEAVATLRKRQWVLIVAAALGIVFGIYQAFTQPRLFQSSGVIQVHNGSSNEYKLDAASDFSGDSQTKMNTEVLILESDTLLTTVAREMNLANNPDFLGENGPLPTQSLDDPKVRQTVIDTLKGRAGGRARPSYRVDSYQLLQSQPDSLRGHRQSARHRLHTAHLRDARQPDQECLRLALLKSGQAQGQGRRTPRKR
jgi:hypothetical protein